VVPNFTILFVEDDTALRDLVTRMLSEKGFGVLSAGDAYEAIRILADRHVDLIFTDIIMPSMDGVQLAKQARLMLPDIKVLFATGYAQKATERDASRHGKVLFKPLREAEVMREVEAALAA
jgi:two-component system, cell cycle response regulator CpdR